jgi:hypothetical protein
LRGRTRWRLQRLRIYAQNGKDGSKCKCQFFHFWYNLILKKKHRGLVSNKAICFCEANVMSKGSIPNLSLKLGLLLTALIE